MVASEERLRVGPPFLTSGVVRFLLTHPLTKQMLFLTIEGQVQLQNIDVGFAKNAQEASLYLAIDEIAHCIRA